MAKASGAIDVSKLSVDERKELMRQLHASQPLSLKASEKGAVSVYGTGRFPVTLYPQQWERVLEHADAIRRFIAENKGKLSFK